MKSNVLRDIKTAASLFCEVRKARKTGSEIRVQQVKQYPVFLDSVGILSTVEGLTLINGDRAIFEIAQKAFNELPFEERHRMSFSPKDGEFADRVQYWRELLRPVMSAKQFHAGIQTIIRWYIHIKRRRLTESAA